MTTATAVHLLPQTNLLRALHATIRDRNATQEDFVFYSGPIIRQLLEAGMDLLPFEPFHVETPVGAIYEGLKLAAKVCAVPIIRSGESMETELRSIQPAMRVGKILIQRDKKTKLPHLLYSHLPEDIHERHVLLLEPMLATGGSALTAVQVLLKAGVKEGNIVFINILAAPEGIEQLTSAHPGLRIVTSSIETRLNENAYMIPGIGDFGDRYFGTVHSRAQ